MNKDPKISVVIPVFNVEKYLRACLDSVIGQTFTDWEAVCIDDGSDDGSVAILREYADRDSRIRLFARSHKGVSAARNAGLDLARGAYLYFLDSDDMLADPRTLEELYELAERERLDQIIFRCKPFLDDPCIENGDALLSAAERYFSFPEGVCGTVMSGDELLIRLVTEGHLFVSEPLRFYRLSCLRAACLRFPEGWLHEDKYFDPLSLHAARRAFALEKRYYGRRIRPDSITTSNGNMAVRLGSMLIVAMRLCANRELWETNPELTGAIRSYVSRMLSVAAGLVKGTDADGLRATAEMLGAELGRNEARFVVECVLSAFRSEARLNGMKRELRVEKDKNRDLRRRLKVAKERPNSIRDCLSFILRRTLKRIMSVFKGAESSQANSPS